MTNDTAAGTRGPYAKGVRRRREILDKTLDVVASRGIDGTSLRAIGEAIGVSHAALTHYFDSREALLVEVLRERDVESTRRVQGIDGVLERMTAAADDNAKVPGLVTLYTNMLATAVEPGNDVSREFFVERFESGRATLARELREQLEASGRHSDTDLELVGSLIMAAFDGLQVQWLLDRRIDIAGTLALLQRLL
ncbi:TetR/AcrR family transcriptional regulator [Frondihabitans australicus]|uniref:TetR family transcriptional regulator n=1 Tax=Frondihabitans australicus TaxID=386892 RepID=A0A495IJI8_9MICO|nr:TetR/AcrR family transcriptional regulator [Frondihabitans australicus]RKR75285.1 TetR family transcriptional regulator [Frondihabitans australicus]